MNAPSSGCKRNAKTATVLRHNAKPMLCLHCRTLGGSHPGKTTSALPPLELATQRKGLRHAGQMPMLSQQRRRQARQHSIDASALPQHGRCARWSHSSRHTQHRCPPSTDINTIFRTTESVLDGDPARTIYASKARGSFRIESTTRKGNRLDFGCELDPRRGGWGIVCVSRSCLSGVAWL